MTARPFERIFGVYGYLLSEQIREGKKVIASGVSDRQQAP